MSSTYRINWLNRAVIDGLTAKTHLRTHAICYGGVYHRTHEMESLHILLDDDQREKLAPAVTKSERTVYLRNLRKAGFVFTAREGGEVIERTPDPYKPMNRVPLVGRWVIIDQSKSTPAATMLLMNVLRYTYELHPEVVLAFNRYMAEESEELPINRLLMAHFAILPPHHCGHCLLNSSMTLWTLFADDADAKVRVFDNKEEHNNTYSFLGCKDSSYKYGKDYRTIWEKGAQGATAPELYKLCSSGATVTQMFTLYRKLQAGVKTTKQVAA